MIETTATRLQPTFSDPDAVLSLIRSAGPFWPLVNYAGNDAEMAALGSKPPTFVPPWFRQDFVRDGVPAVDGAELILDNPEFLSAAKKVYGENVIVKPTNVYVNIMGPTPFPFIPHTDVPAFRGFTRANQPIWFLKLMRNSGLFEEWRTKIATAVSWFYQGEGGDFHYWPDGADGAECVESPPFKNVSVVADNESTFHGVAPLGPKTAQMPEGVNSHSQLVRGDGAWNIIDSEGNVISRIFDDEARITVSWKADIYRDETEEHAVMNAIDGLTIEKITEVFLADLQKRGIDFPQENARLENEEWVALLAATYPELPPKMTLS